MKRATLIVVLRYAATIAAALAGLRTSLFGAAVYGMGGTYFSAVPLMTLPVTLASFFAPRLAAVLMVAAVLVDGILEFASEPTLIGLFRWDWDSWFIWSAVLVWLAYGCWFLQQRRISAGGKHDG